MRAREFVFEQKVKLDPSISNPLKHFYILPGIRNNDAYRAMRVGVAVARARAEIGGVADGFEPFGSESAVGQNARVIGFNNTVDKVIDRALEMTGTPGGKELIGTLESEEPNDTNTVSVVQAFKGY